MLNRWNFLKTGFYEGIKVDYHITIDEGQLLGSFAASHFHNAAAGNAVVRNLNFVNGTAEGTWSSTDASQPLTSGLVSDLMAGSLFVLVHTSPPGFGGGEIRGQVLPYAAGTGFAATLDSGQVAPSIPGVPAMGTGYLSPNPPKEGVGLAS